MEHMCNFNFKHTIIKEVFKMKEVLIIAIAMFLITGCSTLSRMQQGNHNSYLIQGQRYLAVNDYKQAEESFIQAIELGKKTNKTMLPQVMLGETYVKSGDLNAAKNIAEEAVTKWPNESCAWELLGKVNFKRNQLDEAETSFQKALELSKNKAEKQRLNSLISLTKALHSYAQADIQSAEKFFNAIKDEKLAKEVKVKTKEILKMDLRQY